MFQTRITKLLNIKYPILMGAMHHVSDARLVSAVANAGCIGFLPAASFDDAESLRDEIRRSKDLTDGPIGLNVSLIPGVDPGEKVFGMVEVGIKEGISVFETAGRSPEDLVKFTRDSNVPIVHKVPQVRFAEKAESFGVDAVVILGFEGGGYVGAGSVTSMILINKAAKKLSIPVIAAGGIADGRGLVSALALGAEGILMGTRFLASQEVNIHKNFKDWIVNATENDTTVLMRSVGIPVRSMKNDTAKKIEEIEADGGSLESILAVAAPRMGRQAYDRGDVDSDLSSVGESVGLVNDLKGVDEIVRDIVSEAEEVLARLKTLFGNK